MSLSALNVSFSRNRFAEYIHKIWLMHSTLFQNVWGVSRYALHNLAINREKSLVTVLLLYTKEEKVTK